MMIPVVQGTTTLGTFGDTLRKEREKRGITLENVTEGTKIGGRFLRALEAEQFDQLPGGVFNKGFVRAYARHLGLDETKTVADYLAAAGQAPAAAEAAPDAPAAKFAKTQTQAGAEKIRITETVPEPPVEVLEIIRRLPWREMGMVVLLAVAGVAGWRYARSPKSKQTPSRTEVVGALSSAPAPSAAKPTVSPASSAAPAAGQLLIHASEDSWLSVTADGVAQGEIMLLAGETKNLQADREILVKVGNAGGLSFEWNGGKLPPQGEEGEVVTLAFDRTGVKRVAPQPAAADAQ